MILLADEEVESTYPFIILHREKPRGNRAGVIILTGCNREKKMMRADQGTYD